MSHFLFELMVEEIPASMQQQAEKDLTRLFTAAMEAAGVNTQELSLKTASTPVRLVLDVANLPAKTEARTEEKRGPRVEGSLTAEGAAGRALQGFMDSNQVANIQALEKRQTDKGEFYFHVQQHAGRSMRAVLAEVMPDVVKNIPWPKSMRWGAGEIAFVRPIENILALLDETVVSFEVAGLKSNYKSRGHFFLSPEWFQVKSAEFYYQELLKRHVILNREERLAHIQNEVKNLLPKGMSMVPNQSLLNEVAGLVEYPQAILCQFEASFLELPREVLELTMASHQRFFAVENEAGDLTNFFVATSNVKDKKGYIKSGYEKVITARFKDAEFYWQQDLEGKLAGRFKKLESVVFHKKLGTLAQKTNRIVEMVEAVAPHIPNIHLKSAVRAAQLCKCDLVTGVVYEFPELQGIMGHYYAQKDGEDGKVSHAIFWHYEHANLEGLSPEAVALILADRLDTLVGFFGVNEQPTGSKDPFALRRAAISVLKVLEFYGVRISLEKMLADAYAAYQGVLTQPAEKTVAALKTFLQDRLTVMLKEAGMSHEATQAILTQGVDDVVAASKRVAAVNGFMQTEDGVALKEVFRRTYSILQGVKAVDGEVAKSLLVVPEEKELFTRFEAARIDVKKALENEDYARAMSALALMQPPMTRFFEGVMVMAKEENLRSNRLALLQEISQTFQAVAAFEAISG